MSYHSEAVRGLTDDLDRSGATFSSVERVELLPPSSFFSYSSCVDRGATMASIRLSTSPEVILRSNSCDRRFSPPSLTDSPEWWASLTSRNCLVGVIYLCRAEFLRRLTQRNPRFRMRIILGTILIGFQVFSICIPGRLRHASGVTLN